MGTRNMERMEQQAASQAIKSRKGDNLSPLQYITISEKGKSEKLCLLLLEEILHDQKKNLCFHNSLVLQASSQMLTPVLCHELFPSWLQQQKTGQTSSPPCWSYWTVGSCPMVCCTCLSLWQTHREWAVESGTSTLPAPLQRLSHTLQLEQQAENRICISNRAEKMKMYALFSATLIIGVITFSSTMEQIIF